MSAKRFFPLLLSIIILLLSAPFFLQSPLRNWIFNILATGILISALYGITKSKHTYKIVYLAAALSVIAHTLNTYYNYTSSLYMISDDITFIIFLATIVYFVFIALFESHKINTGSVYAAICIYLLLGLLFGMLYSAVETYSPGSFHFIYGTPYSSPLHIRFNLIAFSFSTITTVGNSQVVAIKPFAESLTILEEILGVFYLGVLIARLVTGISVMYKEKL